MEQSNETTISGFTFLSITSCPELQGLLSVLFFAYLLTLLGNLLIVLLIRPDPGLLHSPMYFFLSYLFLADLGFASATMPTKLLALLSQSTAISYSGCFAQMFFFFAFTNADSFLLALMAYD
ncbi:Olfactory receptor 1L8 [Varanus komodoensis]|nr:Olfactory receptor 1L8 [Varanus komodoensis]